MIVSVVSVSSNTNSFGLYGMILLAKDGSAWEVSANSLGVRPKGTVLDLDELSDEPIFARYGFEIPRKLPVPPRVVIRSVWGDQMVKPVKARKGQDEVVI